MAKKLLLFLGIICLLISGGCSSNGQSNKAKKVELTVSAAASLQDALGDIKKEYENKHKNTTLSFNFGASGALQQQISQGAPVDLFFSAAEDKFQKLVEDGSIAKKDGKNMVGNQIVLIVAKDATNNISSFQDLTKARKLAIGTPSSVPAGMYGKETLDHMQIWKEVENKIVYGKDVRQVLNYVETGNVDAGIVYKTDALLSKKVKIVATAKDNTHSPIIYPAGIVKNTKHYEQAKTFFDYLQGDQAMEIFKKYGFKGL
ncbi:molybdate ABC transporter substrate-binding protein [Heyndrickxia camelliae]|uniref:Molybdate ABC transporter substrate-binding protein n=1 Tax=Heyndrickxia camelliae TaxID=1707093 RepID=A0A2N3LJQ6_9BACI|nr:molybdate ABC transporter substrate-binding protein [Heyndrickxia camelliae]PKR84794.1 molybdate ABC transporter substrate-binding protein [Heyndrickxia camelliae]